VSDIRAVVAVLRLAWGSGRRLALGLIGLTALSVLSSGLCGLALKLLVDASVTRDRSAAITGAACAIVGLASGIAWLPLGGVVSLTFQERVRGAFDRHLVEHVTRLHDLELQSSKDYSSALQLLNEDDRDAVATVVLDLISIATAMGLLLSTASFLGLQRPALGLVPAAALPLSWLSWRVDRAFANTVDTVAQDRRLANELFRLGTTPEAAKELRTFGTGPEILRRHAALRTQVLSVRRRATMRTVAILVSSWLVFGLLYGVTIVTMSRRAVAGLASPGDVVLTTTLAVALLGTLQGMAPQFASLSRLVNAARRLAWLTNLTTTRAGETLAQPPSRLAQGISLQGVGFTFAGSTHPALRDVDVSFPAGSVVALVGENGAGKSTLVKLLCGLYAPTEGTVRVDGVDLQDIEPESWRVRVSAVFQDFVRFEFRAREAVGFGSPDDLEDTARLEAAAGRADASEIVASLDHGWETQLGSAWAGGRDLSTGQWQRLALARALMRKQPLLVVLDEPTAALDAVAEQRLFAQFSGVASKARSAGAVTVIVSHRFSTARLADLIVVLDGGAVIEAGTHNELVQRQGLYGSLYALQAEGYA
jgi:ATP-binding cassette subfamily B protein